jgi:two-component system, OmpR family, phosphate regulon sensor histidine kinase PhoR
VKRLLRGRTTPPPTRDPGIEAARGRVLVEESREVVVILDEDDRVVSASRRARELFEGLEEGGALPDSARRDSSVAVPYEVGGRRETLLYLRDAGDMGAYEELRAGFTASVSHELRTPLARLLALLESASLPNSDRDALIEQAQAEVGQIRELIDDVLFLSELESGREVVALGSTTALPILAEVAASLTEQGARAGVTLRVEGDPEAAIPIRPRMIRVIATNLAENAIRYAGPGASLTLSIDREDGTTVLSASDTGVGVDEEDLPRLFERFYRADRARASRGTGLGLAIVKHVVTAGGGTVEAMGERGGGLAIRCLFTTP